MLVPPAMGRYLPAEIPNCHATFFPDAGHLLLDHMSEIVQAFIALPRTHVDEPYSSTR